MRKRVDDRAVSKPRNGRTRIEDLRRQELIDGAHRVFLKYGLSGLTSTRICHEAGMSQGILTYYFKGKDEVLFAMVRKNNRVLVEDVTRRMRAATTKWERLDSIVEGNFPADYFDRTIACAWLSLCAASGQDERFARLQQLFYARLASNVASAVVPVLPREIARDLSFAIGAQIDGLWLRRASDPDLTRERAVALTRRVIERLLGAETVAALKDLPA